MRIMIIHSGRSNIIVSPDHLCMILTLIITLHFQKARQDPTALIHEPIFSKLIYPKVQFPNEVIGFREPIYPLSVYGKSGPWSFTPPQMKVQTGIMEISKRWLSKETNTQSRNASKCFVLKIAQLLQSRFRPKRSWEASDLSNQKALIYITARRQEKQETLCLEKKLTVPRMALQ